MAPNDGRRYGGRVADDASSVENGDFGVIANLSDTISEKNRTKSKEGLHKVDTGCVD